MHSSSLMQRYVLVLKNQILLIDNVDWLNRIILVTRLVDVVIGRRRLNLLVGVQILLLGFKVRVDVLIQLTLLSHLICIGCFWYNELWKLAN